MDDYKNSDTVLSCLTNVQIIDIVCSSKNLVRLKILDTALVDPKQTQKVSCWIYTNEAGILMRKKCTKQERVLDAIMTFADSCAPDV